MRGNGLLDFASLRAHSHSVLTLTASSRTLRTRLRRRRCTLPLLLPPRRSRLLHFLPDTLASSRCEPLRRAVPLHVNRTDSSRGNGSAWLASSCSEQQSREAASFVPQAEGASSIFDLSLEVMASASVPRTKVTGINAQSISLAVKATGHARESGSRRICLSTLPLAEEVTDGLCITHAVNSTRSGAQLPSKAT